MDRDRLAVCESVISDQISKLLAELTVTVQEEFPEFDQNNPDDPNGKKYAKFVLAIKHGRFEDIEPHQREILFKLADLGFASLLSDRISVTKRVKPNQGHSN